MNPLFSSLVTLATAAAGEVGSGRLVGGWNYVWGAFGLLWGAVALYGIWLLVTHRREVSAAASNMAPEAGRIG